MSKNKKPAQAPVVEPAAAEEASVAHIVPAAGAFRKDFDGMDANHIVDCLTGLKEMVHDDPHAAQKFNMSEEQVQYFNELTMCGFATMIAIEVKSGHSPFAMGMKMHQIEAINAVSQYTGITIDVKALPAPTEESTVEVPSTAVKVEKEAATAIAKEVAEAKKEVELDPTKFASDDDFVKAVNHILSTEKNAFSKFERSVALYRGDDAEAIKKIDDMSYSQILEDIFERVDRIPILLNGFGKALYSKVSQFANPVVAFCMLRESSRNKTTGIPAVDDTTIAEIVKVLVKYCANQYIAENDAKIESAKADIEVLSKDKKKNAKGIEDIQNRITTLESNKKHYEDVIQYVYSPSSALADDFIDDYDNHESENYRAAREAYGFITRAYYGADKAKSLNQTALKQNVQQYIGVITNLFRSPNQQLMAYKEAYITELETTEGGTEKN